MFDATDRVVSNGDLVSLHYANPHKTGPVDVRQGVVERVCDRYITIRKLGTEPAEYRTYSKPFISYLLKMN